MEKIMIYPYSRMYEPYVRHSKLMSDIISVLVSPRGWGMEHEKVTCSNSELIVQTDFSNNLSECTAVWFVNDCHNELPEKILLEKLDTAIRERKKIIFTRKSNQTQYKTALEAIPYHLNITSKYELLIPNTLMPNICLNINTPVLTVCGLEENTDKFEVQAMLREKFIEKNYLVSSISSRTDSEILGMHSLPDFLFSSSLSETDKIIQYNHYVKNIEIAESPELIIIGIPGGLMPYDKMNHNHFGIPAYEISYAVPSDIAIMCVLYNGSFDGDYSLLKNDIKYKFGFDVEYCHIAAKVLDTQTTLDDGKRGFVSIERQIVSNKIRMLNRNDIVDMKDNIVADMVVNNIIEKLSGE